MIKVLEYSGHIRNWKELCKELVIEDTLGREAREEQILIKAYECWGTDMAAHIRGMYAFALLDEDNNGLVLNSVHSTEGCYTYTKEIRHGECSIELSNEEKVALDQAMGI